MPLLLATVLASASFPFGRERRLILSGVSIFGDGFVYDTSVNVMNLSFAINQYSATTAVGGYGYAFFGYNANDGIDDKVQVITRTGTTHSILLESAIGAPSNPTAHAVARKDAASTSDSTYAYVSGGRSITGAALKDVWACRVDLQPNQSPVLDSAQLSPMTRARYNHAMVFYRGDLWVIGGTVGPFERYRCNNPMTAYCQDASGTWNDEPTFLSNLDYIKNHVAVVVDDKIVVLGGEVHEEDFGMLETNDKAYIYDGTSWTSTNAGLPDRVPYIQDLTFIVATGSNTFVFVRSPFIFEAGVTEVYEGLVDGTDIELNIILSSGYEKDARAMINFDVFTVSPTGSPSSSPTASLDPTASPTVSPTASPTGSPSASPTASPTVSPTASPTGSPSTSPTGTPTTGGDPSPGAPTPTPTPPSSNKKTAPIVGGVLGVLAAVGLAVCLCHKGCYLHSKVFEKDMSGALRYELM